MLRSRKASLAFILITLAIDAIGLGIVFPVLPDTVRRFVSDEATVSRTYGYFVAVYALMQFISSPLLGRLSDRFGRRPLLLISLFGAAVDYAFMAFAPSLPLLFLGRMISGISGASYSVASAYIADISDDSNRSRNFGLIGAGFGIGFIAGPAIGGLLAAYGPQYPFLAAGCFNLLNFLFGLFVLPESLAPELRRGFGWGDLNPMRSLLRVLKTPSVQALVVAYVLIQLAGQTHPSMWTLYTQHRYGWTATEVGVSLAIVGALSALSQGVLTGKLVSWLGDRKVLNWGTLGEAASYVAFGSVTSGAMMYATLVLSCVFWASQPVLQSLISRETPPHEQGELQGSLMSLTSLTAIINPVLMTALFAWTSDRGGAIYLPGAPYLLGSALMALGWVLILRWERRHPATSPAPDASATPSTAR